MSNKIKPYILTLPLIISIALVLAGLMNILSQSLGYIPGFGLFSLTLDYYKEAFANPDFRESLFLSLFTCALSSLLSVTMGIVICAALVYSGKSAGVLNYIIRLPILIPHTVVAFFVTTILSQSGILSRMFFMAGIIGSHQEFPNLIYNNSGLGIILGYVWKQGPFVAFFTLSLMDSINKTLEESAVNLGASPIRAFFSVTLPLSMPSILNSLLIIAAFSFGAYELPFLLGMTKPKALPVQAYIEYTHPDLTHRPHAMALNGIIVLITLLFATLYFLVMKSGLRSLRNDEK